METVNEFTAWTTVNDAKLRKGAAANHTLALHICNMLRGRLMNPAKQFLAMVVTDTAGCRVRPLLCDGRVSLLCGAAHTM